MAATEGGPPGLAGDVFPRNVGARKYRLIPFLVRWWVASLAHCGIPDLLVRGHSALYLRAAAPWARPKKVIMRWSPLTARGESDVIQKTASKT